MAPVRTQVLTSVRTSGFPRVLRQLILSSPWLRQTSVPWLVTHAQQTALLGLRKQRRPPGTAQEQAIRPTLASFFWSQKTRRPYS